MNDVHPETAAFLTLINSQPSPDFATLGAETARKMYETMVKMFDAPAPAIPVTNTCFKGPAGDVPVRIYHPHQQTDAAPVMIFYHGGGWVIGSLESYHGVCATMAETLGMTVVSVDYRLAPEHPFPAAYEDCIAAADWVASTPAEIAHTVSGICLSGDSAGGNLAAVVAEARAGKLTLLGQFLIYPGVDLTAKTGSMQEFGSGYFLTLQNMAWFNSCYVGTTDSADPRLSPLNMASLAGQPPALLVTCALDPLRDQGRAYAAKLIQHGVQTSYHELPGQVHGCLNVRKAIPSAHAHYLALLKEFRHMIGR